MATIVEHADTGAVYVLLGSGFGMHMATKPNWFFGNWVADREAGQMAMIAVCDFKGRIGWFPSDQLRVLYVDGVTPEQALSAAPNPGP